ncbi:uncharacterized protein [Physcomitrium patens]|uniref:uncharacterized protein isoform X4 n=1 Tax=Physcomitrium patens TaxID=3218 RepID=UPI000D16E4A6|nr:uncharacterized protein LOC112281668 isoform X2 [Physcomitrium patens]|eukprot:XP_024374213.1 uncharacterized protein LOC112281668 isoform X2 [Physcomitrella patens]
MYEGHGPCVRGEALSHGTVPDLQHLWLPKRISTVNPYIVKYSVDSIRVTDSPNLRFEDVGFEWLIISFLTATLHRLNPKTPVRVHPLSLICSVFHLL